jgi:hypothetical protein
MRLSLILFGLSSVFMIVSSLSLGSLKLEKREVTGLVDNAGPLIDNVGLLSAQSSRHYFLAFPLFGNILILLPRFINVLNMLLEENTS